MKNRIGVERIDEHLGEKDFVIMDCRANLLDGEEGRKKYLQGHIPGAYFIDTKKHLSGPMEAHGGRHPLPEIETFKRAIEKMGVTNDTTIVAYDDNQLFTAARLWWQLNYLGHKKVFILEGGIDQWIKKGYPLSKDIPEEKEGNIIFTIKKDMLIEAQEIEKRLKDKDFIMLDARAEARYMGIFEPVDKIAGHIPGAKLYPAEENLKQNGEWKEQEEQEKRFAQVKEYKDIALYCGSGINACMNFIALKELGLQPKLYVGSWSDWITYKDYPVATGEEK